MRRNSSSRRGGSIVLLGLLVVAGLSFSGVGRDSNSFPEQAMLAGDSPSAKKSEVAPADRGVPTDEWAVRLPPGSDPDDLAKQLGAENLGQVGALRGYFLFRFPRPDPQLFPIAAAQSDVRTAELLGASPQVQWFEQQIARQQHPREPSDPRFGDQWHLENTGQSGGTAGQDVNVLPVWNSGIEGTGVVIGIVDDGLQHDHPDLAPNYLAGASYDFNDDDSDPSPDLGLNCDASADCHGTSVAGVAAARDDGSACGVGAAYRAGLAGLRLIAGPSTDADEAAALTHEYNTIDIYSNSWGPTDDARRLEGPGPLTQLALAGGVTSGRGGLGSIYVWAAGNGLGASDNVNYDGYANSRFTIAVGAVDHDGVQSGYSEPGAAMLVTAPSSGDGVRIFTTDLLGFSGYDFSRCTDDFGGTSSATPLAAGVVALMLEANPGLTWRDVQHILVETAVQNDPGDADWTANGAGHLINHKYGFGRIDAQAAVSAASTWTNVGPAVSTSAETSPNLAIPDDDASGVISSVTIGDSINLEHVEVVFNATHTYRGNLEIVLTSPSGTQSVLAEKHLNDGNNDYDGWRFMTVRHWGESSVGTWTLRVADRAAQDTGTFDSWTLVLHGTAGPPITLTSTPTATVTDTPTATSTSTSTPTATDTPTTTPTSTVTNTPTATLTSTATATSTDTPTATETSTATDTATSTPTGTPTSTSTPTSTATPTPTGTVCVRAGDVDGDGEVTVNDVNAVANLWPQMAGPPFDCNGDGVITVEDIICVVQHLGEKCT